MTAGRLALVLLKALVTAGLILWLVLAADWAQLGALLLDTRWTWLVAAVALHAMAFVLLMVRWWIVLRHLMPEVRFSETVPAVYLGLFANNFMPAGTGVDVAKIFGMRSSSRSAKGLAAAVFIERIVGLAAVITIGAVALWAWSPERFGIAQLTLAALLGFAAGLLALLFTPLSRWGSIVLRRRFAGIWARHLADMLDNIHQFRFAKAEIVSAFLITVLLQSLVVTSYIALGAALRAEIHPTAYFVAIPLVFLMVSLPVSFGGLGVREGTFVAIMVVAGMAEQVAIGVSVLYLFQLLVLTLPGGLLLLRSQPWRDSPAA